METHSPDVPTVSHDTADLDRLGDEIAELSAHLDAAPAQLLDLIREVDPRGGWDCVDRQAEARETKRQHANRGLHVYHDDAGMVVVRGRLEPEAGALLMQALSAARETLYQQRRAENPEPLADPASDTPTMAQQQADALALIAETALHHELDPGAPGERYQVVVHVDAAALADADQPGDCVLEEGTRG